MPLKIEELRSKGCLAGFRCGVGELESFCKKAYKRHTREYPDSRVRVLYDGEAAQGFHTLSVKSPGGAGMMLDPKTAYHGSETFLYLDHFAVHTAVQKQGLSTVLMLDVVEIAAKTMSRYGRIFALTLNAANDDARQFFEKWGFASVTKSTSPFMVMDRPSLLSVYMSIKAQAVADALAAAS